MMENDGLLDYSDDGYIELVLRILGLMCDGQNQTLQVTCNGYWHIMVNDV